MVESAGKTAKMVDISSGMERANHLSFATTDPAWNTGLEH
jgi:hypothetical protein